MSPIDNLCHHIKPCVTTIKTPMQPEQDLLISLQRHNRRVRRGLDLTKTIELKATKSREINTLIIDSNRHSLNVDPLSCSPFEPYNDFGLLILDSNCSVKQLVVYSKDCLKQLFPFVYCAIYNQLSSIDDSFLNLFSPPLSPSSKLIYLHLLLFCKINKISNLDFDSIIHSILHDALSFLANLLEFNSCDYSNSSIDVDIRDLFIQASKSLLTCLVKSMGRVIKTIKNRDEDVVDVKSDLISRQILALKRENSFQVLLICFVRVFHVDYQGMSFFFSIYRL